MNRKEKEKENGAKKKKKNLGWGKRGGNKD